MNREEDDKKSSEDAKAALGLGIGLLVFALVWVIAGIVAFIKSLMCFGSKGTTAQKVIGFLLSVFVGPFYWIYYYATKYCKE